MAGNRFGTWKKRTAAVFMAVCLLGAMPGAVWAADTADGLGVQHFRQRDQKAGA